MNKVILTLFCLLAFKLTAHAASYEIVGQGGQRFPVAVSPLKNLGASTGDSGRLSTGIADAMIHDLELSGWFREIGRAHV